jgi:threonine dehydrogenase-like Zn-dependent dehydrogenase
MPKLKGYKRVITSDFDAQYKDLVEQLGGTLNDSFNDLYFAVNGRLDIRSNIACTVRDIDIIVDSTGNPVNRTIFTLTNPQAQVLGITVISAINQSNSNIYPTGQPFISFSPIQGGILINNITGLQANQRYTVRLIAWN